MERKQAKEMIDAALGSIQDNLNSMFYNDGKAVRYDFSWAKLDPKNGYMQAIVKRHEWDPGRFITELPSRSLEFRLEVDHNSLRMRPVPPAKTFCSPPEDERTFLEAVIRAYFAGMMGEHDYICWERVPSS